MYGQKRKENHWLDKGNGAPGAGRASLRRLMERSWREEGVCVCVCVCVCACV